METKNQNPFRTISVLTTLLSHQGSTPKELHEHLVTMWGTEIMPCEQVLATLTEAMYKGLARVTHGSNTWECTELFSINGDEALVQ